MVKRLRRPIPALFIAESTTSDFIAQKLALIASSRQSFNEQKDHLIELYSQPTGQEKKTFLNEIQTLKRKIADADNEWLTLKRQKKILREDLSKASGTY